MQDKDFFYSTYKEIASKFRDEILQRENNFLLTFPTEDRMRQETFNFLAVGGKRLRTVLSRVVTLFLGQEETQATGTLDVFHKFLLCHDDIIDRDRIRWGLPTVHAALEADVRNESEKVHFGNGLAIIAGDLIAAEAYRLTLESQLSDSVKVKLMMLVCQAMDEVAWGWYDQFLMDYESLASDKLSEARITNSIIWVTGKYTISFPLRYGYAIREMKMPEVLESIADDMGVLFQTGDDLIGIFGDSEVSGKSNYGDIVQGKKTLPIWFAYQMANTIDRERLVCLVGKKDLTDFEADEVRQIMRSSKAYDYVREYMHTRVEKIKAQLENADIPSELRRFLSGFADYLFERES